MSQDELNRQRFQHEDKFPPAKEESLKPEFKEMLDGMAAKIVAEKEREIQERVDKAVAAERKLLLDDLEDWVRKVLEIPKGTREHDILRRIQHHRS